MAENDRSGQKPSGQEPGGPRWVKVIGIVVAALVALLILARVTGIAGDHGPNRHIGGLAPALATAAGAGVAAGSWVGIPGW